MFNSGDFQLFALQNSGMIKPKIIDSDDSIEDEDYELVDTKLNL